MRGIRGSIWLIVAAALLPLLLFVIFQIGYSAREQRRSTESRALARSEAVILAADARVERQTTGIDALATSHSLRARDWVEFRARAQEISEITGDWSGVQLIDPATGSTLVSIGTVPERIVRSVPSTKASDRKFIGFAWGRNCPCLTFERFIPPVDGKRLLLRVLVRADPFTAMLPPVKSEYPVSAIVGPNGIFVARTVAMEKRFGTAGSNYLRAAIANDQRQGIYRGFTLEGFKNYTAFTRSSLTGWSAHVALGSKYIDSPARRYLASLGFAALTSLLLAGLLILFALRQLAEARRLAEHMQQAQKLEALGQLTGGIAHDFNNLLTPIIGSLEFVSAKADLDERSQRLLKGGLESARRASKLTGQLLAFSRRQRLSMETIDLCHMVEEMRPLLQQSAGPGVDLEIRSSAEHCWVQTDPTQFELALINLVLNARDASPPGGRIDLNLEVFDAPSGEQCMLTIADQGEGMADEVRRRAFEPFFTTKPLGKGTGLGLAQVYALAQQSHGSVRIDSGASQGTRVSLTFPCQPEPDSEGAIDLDVADIPVRPSRILVVEDEADVRASIIVALEQDGHHIDEADSGPAALEMLAKAPFDVLVADFAMPGMTGAQLIGEVRTRYPAIRALIVTGYLDSAAVEAAAPGTPIIAKPFDSAKLRRLIRRIVAD